MIDPQRREVLRALEELSAACPEYRFGQMIANLAMLARGDAEGAIWEMEDAELLAAAGSTWSIGRPGTRPSPELAPGAMLPPALRRS